MIVQKARTPPAKLPRHSPDSIWQQHLKDLKAFRARYGHCNVPHIYAANQGLANWVARVRARKSGFSPERIRSLDAIGFCWALRKRSVFQHDWAAMLHALTSFVERHGHCRVPSRSLETARLAAWLSGMRQKKRAGKLSYEKIEKLEKLGVVWEPEQERWQQMYSALAAFKRKHGHCRVPRTWPENSPLAYWVGQQRSDRKVGKLQPDCIKQLNVLGFVWDDLVARWETMYAALVEFHKKHGHCNVSTLSKTRLGLWVKNQRAAHRQGRLSKERISRLEQLGFDWQVSRHVRYRPSEKTW